jgi:solute carrier family 44 protein 1 (choline transporter-like protein)
MAIDTIFLCFCEDSDKNDGVKKPYYMSLGLMVIYATWKKKRKHFCFQNVLG